jgi:hypothetical protein
MQHFHVDTLSQIPTADLDVFAWTGGWIFTGQFEANESSLAAGNDDYITSQNDFTSAYTLTGIKKRFW